MTKNIKSKKLSILLSSNVVPINYNLTIKPDLLASVFFGYEDIHIQILDKTNSITLHSKDIDIENAKYVIGKKIIFSNKITYNTKNETVTIHFDINLNKGKGILSLVFTGIINDNLHGFYKSKYVVNGIENHIATTQFESTDARRAFPCFDEPNSKATFSVSLIIPNDKTAISNTLPNNIREHDAGYKIVSFSPTPIMSTYLLAFIIGDFEYVEGFAKFNNSRDVQIRIFTTNGKKHQAKFALDVAIKSLEFYTKYFNIPYPLENLDLIALPDFGSAAMENWGAVTFRETALLVDDDHTSISNKQWAAIVIAHEIAHQWFGNLVTMHWWTDLWLNEGFASYMENLCIDNIFPEWKIWDLYIADRYNLALKLDSLSNSHPIEIHVNHPSEISEIFDMVSYAKGSAVIRMLAEYLGHEKFRLGLEHYLKKHSYKNTKTVDLWKSFEIISKKPVIKIMKDWTDKTGYPLISLISKKDKNSSDYNFTINQTRFYSSRINKKENSKNILWNIPLTYLSSGTVYNTLMTKKEIPLLGNDIGKINLDERSFIRVMYDTNALTKLKNLVINKEISTRDRLGIIRDLFALAEGGYINTTTLLDFSLAYKNEEEYIVWKELSIGINKIFNLIKEESFASQYKQYALSLFSPLANKIGFKEIVNSKNTDILLQNLMLSQAAFYGDKKIISLAKEIFYNRDLVKIRADLRDFIYQNIAYNGNKKEWKILYNLYLNESFHEEKDRIAHALSLFKNEDILNKTLKFATSLEVRSQDAPFIISNIWINSFGKKIVWNYIKDNWSEIISKYGSGHFMPRLLSPIGTYYKKKDLIEFRKFFSKNIAPGAERSLLQSFEKIESNIAWLYDDKKNIKKWLNNFNL